MNVTELPGVRSFRVGSFTATVNPTAESLQVTSYDWDGLQGTHTWRHHGRESIWHFLSGIDTDYAAKKLFSSEALHDVDVEATTSAMLAAAVSEDIDADDTAEIKDYLESCYEYNDFLGAPHLSETHLYIRHKDSPGYGEFSRAWPAFREYLKTAVIPFLGQHNP